MVTRAGRRTDDGAGGTRVTRRRAVPGAGRIEVGENEVSSADRSASWRVGTVVVCLLAGLLLATARTYSRGEDIRNRSIDLSLLVKGAGSRVSAAQARAAQLQREIDALAGSDVSPQVATVRDSTRALLPGAGLTAVRGPALRVALDDAQRDSDGNYPDGVDPDALVVHQQDVQSVVNALWAGGAEAMMIMDQRVVTTSAVRCIGNTLLLQGRAYSPPFVITAIGNSARMAQALDDEPGVALFQSYVAKYRLGFQITPVAQATLPAYAGLLRLTAAHQEAR